MSDALLLRALISAFCGRGRRCCYKGSGTQIGCVTHKFLARVAQQPRRHPVTQVRRICNPAAGGKAPHLRHSANHLRSSSQHERNGRRPGATLTCGTTIRGAHRHHLVRCAGPPIARRARAVRPSLETCGSSTAAVGPAASVTRRSYSTV